MKKQVHSDPENVYVASGYKEIGGSVELNRQRIVNVIASFTRENSEAAIRRLQDYTEDNTITETEKESLKRELAALDRDYENLVAETSDADFGETQEFLEVRDAYTKIHDLLYKIVNTPGTYRGEDVQDITVYYQDYVNKATILENKILDATAEIDRIGAYYMKTQASVSVYPELVAYNTSTTITASLLYEGVEKIGLVSASAITFGITGLSDSATSSMFTLPQGSSITMYPITNSAVIVGAKTFQMAYNAIGVNGADVRISIELDSDSMPF